MENKESKHLNYTRKPKVRVQGSKSPQRSKSPKNVSRPNPNPNYKPPIGNKK